MQVPHYCPSSSCAGSRCCAYLGGDGTFARAIADFARAYADQNERDYQALADAEKSGRIVAQFGV